MIFLLVLHDSNSYFKDLGSEATEEVKLFILSFLAEGLLQRSNQRDTSSSINPPSFQTDPNLISFNALCLLS